MKKKIKLLSLSALAFLVLLVACVYIDSVDVNQVQPDGTVAPRVQAGDTAVFKVKGHLDIKENVSEGDQLVVAVLAPKCWNLRENATASYHANVLLDETEEQTMSLIAENVSPKNMAGYTWAEALMERFGIGTNRYNDMEWVTWQADKAVAYYNGSKPDYEITIRCKTSNDNLTACIGFCVNYVGDGLSNDADRFKVVYSDPFTVYGGLGEEIDYTKIRFNTVEPSRALQDDFVTFTFSGDAFDNHLIQSDEIYLEATARTDAGNEYTVADRSAKTLMKRTNTFSHTYSVTLWPKDFFNIPAHENIETIRYFFTNKDGSVIVNKSLGDLMSGDTPASNDIPFSFILTCGY